MSIETLRDAHENDQISSEDLSFLLFISELSLPGGFVSRLSSLYNHSFLCLMAQLCWCLTLSPFQPVTCPLTKPVPPFQISTSKQARAEVSKIELHDLLI